MLQIVHIMCLLVYRLPPGFTPKLSMLMLKTLLPQFIRSIRATDPAIVLVDDTQITDMVRFCTSSIEFGILTVDPTFSLGEFDMTPITYRHLLLETKKNRNTPVFLGPILVHYRKNFSTYVLLHPLWLAYHVTSRCAGFWNRWGASSDRCLLS